MKDQNASLPPETWEEEELDEAPRLRKPRPEAVMGIVALLTAVVLLVLVVICIPHFREKPQEEDPEDILHAQRQEEESLLKDNPLEMETTEETEPTEPTIPPESNPYNQRDFQYGMNNFLLCTKQDSYPGIDVSQHQGEVDWQQVADSGIRFAIVRLGYRGWGKAGKMVEDRYARQNLTGAKEAGIAVGAYFFSQALNLEEVDQEISYMLEILGNTELDMPIILDWEIPETGSSDQPRTAGMDARTLTDCLLHFCQTMEAKGYKPMVYFNWSQSRKLIYLHELEDYPFWLALYQDRMTYPYRVEMWQYTCTGRVPGIQGDVDVNVFMPDGRKQ